MSAARDAVRDALLTAPPEKAWQTIFKRLWEIFSATLEPSSAEREVTKRERNVGELERFMQPSSTAAS